MLILGVFLLDVFLIIGVYTDQFRGNLMYKYGKNGKTNKQKTGKIEVKQNKTIKMYF